MRTASRKTSTCRIIESPASPIGGVKCSLSREHASAARSSRLCFARGAERARIFRVLQRRRLVQARSAGAADAADKRHRDMQPHLIGRLVAHIGLLGHLPRPRRDRAGRSRARMEVVRILAAEVANLLAVTPTVDLTFTTSRGEYERALQSRGYDLPPACASDCSVLSGAAVDPQYCSGGLAHGYDAVLSVTKPPGIEGVAGTGSACAFDQVRRPLWLVLAWHSSIVGISQLSVNEAVDQYRAFVRHEMLHGLGFVNSMFFYARDSRGERKNLIEPRPVVDTDGARDEVWTFVRGRAYELAQHYFNCYGNATDPDASTRGWDGLPLMGLPEAAARRAHWETRILRDEVMSYGFRSIVSSITLAAMEDLGFYLANYSAAECMSWGHKQGCSYVRSRCGVGMHDQSHFFTPARLSQCRGDPYWSSHPDSYLTSKCTSGNDPCSTSQQAGYDGAVTLPDGRRGAKCDSQCYYGDSGVSREGCSTPPSSEVEATGGDFLDSLRDNLSTVDWEAWILPAAVGVILLSAACYSRSCASASARIAPTAVHMPTCSPASCGSFPSRASSARVISTSRMRPSSHSSTSQASTRSPQPASPSSSSPCS